MDHNYNFNRNPENLDRERIDAHQDFAGLLKKHLESAQETETPVKHPVRSLNWWRLGGLAAAGFALLWLIKIAWFTPATTDLLALQNTYFAQQNLVNPPIPPIDPPFSAQKVEAAKGGAFQIQEGLKMVVPEYAFMDDRGQQILGEVDVQYRTLQDAVDFFLAGIPLTYDSAGQVTQMESAGMIEVLAYQNGSSIQLQANKPIRVELSSRYAFDKIGQRPNFKIYRLDTIQGKWVYETIDEASWILEANDQPAANSEAPAEVTFEALQKDFIKDNPKPLAPQNDFSLNENDQTFELDLLNSDFELDETTRKILKDENPNGIWRVDPDASFNPLALSATWETVRLEPVEGNAYRIRFSSGEAALELKVYPVYIGEVLKEAETAYETALAQYEDALSTWENKLENWRLRTRDSLQAVLNSNTAERTNKAGAKSRVLNIFSLDQLGIWNCGRLIQIKDQLILEQIEDETGQNYVEHTAYMTTEHQNTLYQFYAGEKVLLPLGNTLPEQIWIVANPEQLALVQDLSNTWSTSSGLGKSIRLKLSTASQLSQETIRGIIGEK